MRAIARPRPFGPSDALPPCTQNHSLRLPGAAGAVRPVASGKSGEVSVFVTLLPKLLSAIALSALITFAGLAIEWDRRRRNVRLPIRSHAPRNRGAH